MSIDSHTSCHREVYGQLADGRSVARFHLRNGPLEVCIIEYGAILESVVYDHVDRPAQQLCRRLTTLSEYEEDGAYIGAVVGPVANRIGYAQYLLEDRVISVATNEGPHQLHGGPNGLHQRLWHGREAVDMRGPSVELECTHEDGCDGYVGDLFVRVRYTLGGNGELYVEYTAVCDQPRPVSLTSHPYFGFVGERNLHVLTVHSCRQLEVDHDRVPTGRILDVSESAHDFSRPRPTSDIIVDNTYLFAENHPNQMVAALQTPSMILDVYTDQPALQVYVCRDDQTDETWVCLEPHGYVDATKHPHFPSVMLLPNQLYQHRTLLHWRAKSPV